MRIIDAVRQIRSLYPGIGGYKLWLMIKQIFKDEWVPGREKFFALLTAHQLNLPRPKPRHTTNSNHRFRKYRNLIIGFIPTAPNQLWVSDITYIEMENGCCYLHIVTDAYSHKIIGWYVSDTLEARYTIMALMMAIKAGGKDDLAGLIHHSDRGSQYCCEAYVALLNKYHISISMTEDYKPTNNAIAERVNGILKTEVLYRTSRPKTLAEARKQIGDTIAFYNEQRPHMSIGYQTPCVAHEQSGLQERCWKNYWEKTCINEKKVVPLSPETELESTWNGHPKMVDASTILGQSQHIPPRVN